MSFYGATLGETIVAGVIEGAKKLQGEVAAADARAKAEATP
jgi:hypothetical protein